MKRKSRTITTTPCLVTASLRTRGGWLDAQPTTHLAPASLQNAQTETLEQLGVLADSKVTSDMAWALRGVDRVRAEREEIFNEHAEIIEALNRLIVAITAASDQHAKEISENAAADALADVEILEPTILLIGETLRAKLPKPH